jgi:type IV pilus assembly protein PilC
MKTNNTKLNTYIWEGINPQGLRVSGTSHAINDHTVSEQLRCHSITPIKIHKKFSLFSSHQRVKNTDILDFSRQLSTLIEAGIALAPALQIIADGYDNPRMHTLAINIKQGVESGQSLSEALNQYPNYFSTLYCNLIAAGEHVGALDALLKQLVSYQEKLLALANKIKKALFYPVTVLLVALAVTIIMLIFVVPQFQTIFANFGAALPLYTQVVIHLADFLQTRGWVLILLGGLSLLLFQWARKQPVYAIKIDAIKLQIPILGKLIQQAIIARVTRTLAITCTAGLPIAEALTMVAASCDNLIYTSAVLQSSQQVTSGLSLQQALQNTQLFPSRVIQMVSIGEESGTLPRMLAKIADYYEAEVDHSAETLTKLLEPLMMVVLGLIIGGLIAAMYLPIFKLGSVI